MTINTAEKRFSAINIAAPWRGINALPDGVVLDTADRIGVGHYYSGLAVGNVFTLTAESGVFSWAGNDATFTATEHIGTADKRFSAMNVASPWRGLNTFPSGSIALPDRYSLNYLYDGFVTAAVNAYTITCESGSFTWDGEPSFSDFEISCVSGVFSWTGQDASLIATRTLFAGTGSYAWTGYDATLIKFTERTLTATSGVFSWTGQDAVFDRPRTFSLESGVFGYSGYSAGLTWYRADGTAYPDPLIARRRAGGIGSIKRNYRYKGTQYYQLTNEELARLIARDLVDVSREDIQVTYKGQKPHKIGKEVFEAVVEEAAKIPVTTNDEQDIEDILALL